MQGLWDRRVADWRKQWLGVREYVGIRLPPDEMLHITANHACHTFQQQSILSSHEVEMNLAGRSRREQLEHRLWVL